MPYYPQEANQCGPASLAMILGHRGLEVTPEELEPGLFIPQKTGTLAIELQAQARQYGLLAYPLAAQLDDLLTEIEAGNPALVMQNLGFSWYPRWHFAVAFGVDPEAEQILLRSGPNETYAVPLSLFEKTWARADYWAMVVLHPDDLPATAQPLQTAVAANALEQTGQTDAAAQVYEGALQQWPDHSLALFGLGNIRYQQGRLGEAQALLRRRAEQHPNTPETWNNLAYVEWQLGCPENARTAVACALKLEPGNEALQNSVAEFSAVKQNPGQCAALPDCPE